MLKNLCVDFPILSGLLARGLVFVFALTIQFFSSVSAQTLPVTQSIFSNRPVVLVQSESTRSFFSQGGGNHDLLTGLWRAALTRIEQPFSSAPLNSIKLDTQPGVLILPSTVSLDNADRQLLRALLARGWSVFGTWAMGARDAQGQWQGYGFIDEIFAAKVLGDVDLRKTNGWFLLPFGETPVTFTLKAGERVYLPKIAEPVLIISAAQVAARGDDWTRAQNLGTDTSGLVSYLDRGAARRLYWSFPETAWDASRAQMDQLLRAGLSWLKREPTIVKSAWPNSYESAYLIEMDTEEQFANSVNLAQMLEQRQWTGTFYLLTSLVKANAELVRRLGQKHELGYHADVHDGFKGIPIDQQQARLKNMMRELGSVLSDTSGAKGFRAPLESFDKNTEIAIRSAGLSHHASSPDAAEHMLPTVSVAEPGVHVDKALLVLPRTLLDDVNFGRMGFNSSAKIQSMLVNGAREVARMRGLGLLSVHSQNFAKNSELFQAMPPLLEFLNDSTHKIWVAPASKIETWWRARDKVSVSINWLPSDQKIASQNAQVSLQNAGISLSGLKLIVMAPDASSELRLNAQRKGWRVQKLDADRWAVLMDELPSGITEFTLGFSR
jgi:peptidoglycan/xylan/chitin deacetylase (PgdA/CDA1 family)